ncbi:MAG: hypothetical protein KGI38_00080 [Thaumarchaeota archaeon]|nr:hypothetical protein [Nitrososphaerota archaeon]
MKKTYVAAIAILAAIVIVLAAAVALLQYQPSSSGSGKLAVMGTDPAVASSGVSAATIAYSSVYAHQAGSDMASGWTQVSGSGTMNLMASQGTAQTLATSQVNAATYDAFKFNVDSCNVVYQGQTYAATVASTTLTAQSQSKVQVNASSSSAAVVDLRTFIENTATTSSPQFVFSATAVATSVPPQTEASLSLQIGATADLSGQAWWSTFMSQTSTNLNVVATLSSGSMTLNLQNSGSANAEVQEIIITPVSATAYISGSLPASLSGSAVFTVSGSSSVQQSSSFQASALLNGGATVASGSSSTLTYTGNIATGQSVVATGIVAGQQYIITCIGANTYSSTTVVAS